jgi:hypothetical protein
MCDVLANGFDRGCGLVSEQERKLVDDTALAVGQVDVADIGSLQKSGNLTRHPQLTRDIASARGHVTGHPSFRTETDAVSSVAVPVVGKIRQ